MCWLCGAATGRAHTYSGIEGHSCAGYQTNQEMKEKSQAKEALDVYIHYFDKYRVHMQSLDMARQKEAEVLQSMAVLERKEDELVDWLWIGLKQLFRMRRFLAWSYVFGYYAFFAFPGVSGEVKALQVLFETLQNRLQNNVEDLSLLVEGRPENMTMDTKPRVLSLCHNTHQQASNFFVFMEKEIVRRLPRNGGAGPSHEYFPIHKLVVGLGAKPLTADLDLDEEEDVVKEEMAEAGVVKKLKKKAQRWFS
jgi:ariadne-1